jgi:hypothetical protein
MFGDVPMFFNSAADPAGRVFTNFLRSKHNREIAAYFMDRDGRALIPNLASGRPDRFGHFAGLSLC